MIPHSRPTVGRSEERAVTRVLRSHQLGGGDEVERFERELARKVGTGHAVATHTGSAALHLALLALKLKPGAKVLLPTYVCAAVLHAVRTVGARPVLLDVDPVTANLDWTEARRKSRGASAIIVAHMFGLPAPIEEFRRLNIPIIEDCAMAIGARHRNRPCGSFGDLSLFSFYATKMMATGHGGAVATSRPELARRIRDLVEYDNRNDDRLRYNYRMSAVAAALGRVQLGRLAEFIQARRRIADFYYERLRGRSLILPPPGEHVFHRFVLRGGPGLTDRLKKAGVEAKRPVYLPLHRYKRSGRGSFPGAEELHRTALSIPIYPSLSRRDAARVAEAVAALTPA